LEDIHDLEAHSILRLFEQSPPSPAAHPPPILPPRIPTGGVISAGEPIEYLSEPEMLLEWNGRNAGGKGGGAMAGRELAQLRPASVLGGERDGSGGNGRRRRSTGFTPLMMSNDWSGHSSDTSSCSAGAQYPKSGSSTPTREDREETRRKVDR
jgi:hypothetical protein